jgi:hypothetical protein
VLVELTPLATQLPVQNAIGETSSPLIPSLTVFVVLAFVDG